MSVLEGSGDHAVQPQPAKFAHERAMLSGPIPVPILRAAQLHELVAQLVEWGRRDEVSYVPEMRTQLVAARVAAEALADLATSRAPESPGAVIPEIAGPRVESLVELDYLSHTVATRSASRG